MATKRKSDKGIAIIKKRVHAMVKQRPSHKEVLEFLGEVAVEQFTARPKVKTSPLDIDEEHMNARIIEGLPLVEKKVLILDMKLAAGLFKRLCKIMGRNKKVSQDIEQITQAIKNKHIDIKELLKQVASENNGFITALSEKLAVKKSVLAFLAINSLKPIFEAYAKEFSNYVDQERWVKGYCPICGSAPVMAELRKDGSRFLLCSSCGYEWRFNRLKCPFCENDEQQSLRYFYSEQEGRTYRVDVCEKCKRYIKTVETDALVGKVISLLEDAGTFHFDIIAQNAGYRKGAATSELATNA
jgi:FdhE protein